MRKIMNTFNKALAALTAVALIALGAEWASAPAQADYVGGQQIDYCYNALDWHTGAVTRYVQGPAGKRGYITNVMISPTTSFVGTSAPANVQVGYGTGANLYAYANVNVGAANAGTAVGTVVVASTYAAGLTQLGTSATFGEPPFVGQTAGYMAKDTPVIITFNPATGGGVAGVADVVVSIKWF
jgi:hypothetical protein